MPRITIRRQWDKVGDDAVCKIRDAMPPIIADVLKVESEEVEVLVQDFGPFDINIAPIGIDVLTGTGKNDWRFKHRSDLSEQIESRVWATGLIAHEWVEGRSYVWLLVTGSSFVPIGAPDLKR